MLCACEIFKYRQLYFPYMYPFEVWILFLVFFLLRYLFNCCIINKNIGITTSTLILYGSFWENRVLKICAKQQKFDVKAAQRQYINLVGISEKDLFWPRTLYDGKGSKASVFRGLFTACLTRIKTKGLTVMYFSHTQIEF